MTVTVINLDSFISFALVRWSKKLILVWKKDLVKIYLSDIKEVADVSRNKNGSVSGDNIFYYCTWARKLLLH